MFTKELRPITKKPEPRTTAQNYPRKGHHNHPTTQPNQEWDRPQINRRGQQPTGTRDVCLKKYHWYPTDNTKYI